MLFFENSTLNASGLRRQKKEVEFQPLFFYITQIQPLFFK